MNAIMSQAGTGDNQDDRAGVYPAEEAGCGLKLETKPKECGSDGKREP